MLLALDVGFARMGWAVFENGEPVDWGIIRTEKTKKKMVRVADDNATRVGETAYRLRSVIKMHDVKAVVAELPHGGARNARAMAHMAMGTAIVASVCSLLDLPVEWTTPAEGKLAICGKKSASKKEMMEEVRGMYPDIKFPIAKCNFEDIADAVGSYVASTNGNLVKLFG